MAYTRDAGRTFWYEFDRRTKYNDAFWPIMGQAGAGDIQGIFTTDREDGTYPHTFNAYVAARRNAWLQVADIQRTIIDELMPDRADLQKAFEDFGQGNLHDDHPERQNGDMIHTMDAQSGSVPIGYHRWHASIRAIESLGPADPARWSHLAKCVGLAWAIQSKARPKQRATPNPDMAAGDLQRLRDAWLPLTPAQLDAQYDRTGSSGYHPSPFDPLGA